MTEIRDHNMFFITGFPRSGTTLTERLLGNQKNTFVAHQAFPNLFIGIKDLFLKKNNVSRDYPFLPNPSNNEKNDFLEFLIQTSFSSSEIKAWFQDGKNYKAFGEYKLLNFIPASGTLINVIRQSLIFLSEGNTNLGFKDVMMDEFIPYFYQNSLPSVVVIRDPRAVIASLIHSDELGYYRPTLFNLQLWKRTVRYSQEIGAHVLRYEDLVSNPKESLEGLKKLPFPSIAIPEILRDNKQQTWKGNSSFHNPESITTTSVTKFRQILSNQAQQYIESICVQEMKRLGYLLDFEPLDAENLTEPFKITHRNFEDWDNAKELYKELHG